MALRVAAERDRRARFSMVVGMCRMRRGEREEDEEERRRRRRRRRKKKEEQYNRSSRRRADQSRKFNKVVSSPQRSALSPRFGKSVFSDFEKEGRERAIQYM